MISADAARAILALLDQLRALVEKEAAKSAASPAPAIPAAPPPPAPPPPPTPSARPKDASGFFDSHARFYDFLRGNKMLGPVISGPEFEGCEAIIIGFAMAGAPVSYVAYGLATAYLETAASMQPVLEANWLSAAAREAYFTRMYDIRGARPAKARELGNINPGDGARFAGRGYVQLTGRTNYARATAKLRALGQPVDLVANPDLAMRADLAAMIMVHGMIEGWFTGRSLDDDLLESGPSTRQHFVDSRDIINGRDKAGQIADYAVDFQTGLLAAGYRPAPGVKL